MKTDITTYLNTASSGSANYNKIKKERIRFLVAVYFDILQSISDVMELPIREVMSKSRRRDVSDARSIFIGIAYSNFGCTTIELGEFINRHHSSIVHSIAKNDSLYNIDLEYRKLSDSITKVASERLGFQLRQSRYQPNRNETILAATSKPHFWENN